jgi:hypothetical protein
MPSTNMALTPTQLRRTLASTMPAGFEAASAKAKEPVANFWANEEIPRRHQCGRQLFPIQLLRWNSFMLVVDMQ